jgi:tRNA1(Val) A37 N6-methylase TrmN6
MFLHPTNSDIFVSGSFIPSIDGNGAFEEAHKVVFYRIIMDAIEFKKIANPVVLDIGANIGIHSFFYAALGAETHAFEPFPVNWRSLSCSWDANPFLQKRLHIYNAAIGNETKKLCVVLY